MFQVEDVNPLTFEGKKSCTGDRQCHNSSMPMPSQASYKVL